MLFRSFFVAFQEAMKRYKNEIKEKSGIASSEDRDIVSKAFGKDGILETTA